MRRLFLLAVLLTVACQGASNTILVLPLFNLSKTANLDWIGESIAETIREGLASSDLLVLGREQRNEAFRRLSVRPYALLTRATVIKLGETLDAAKVVYGTYEIDRPADDPDPSKSSLRITARILDLERFKQSSEYGEIGSLSDLAALQTHLAWQTLKFLLPGGAPTEEEFRKARPPVRVDAIENYIRGLLAESADQKERFFTQAARLDPRFSQALFELGRLCVRKKNYPQAAIWLERVAPADSHYLEAQFWLGVSRYYAGDFAKAESAFDLVARSVPLNEVLNDLGAAQSRRNLPEATENFRKAVEGDNSDPDYHFNLAYALWKQGNFEEAATGFRAVLERSPEDPDATLLLGRCLQHTGPRRGDPKSDGLERLKLDYEETAYRQLKAELEPKR